MIPYIAVYRTVHLPVNSRLHGRGDAGFGPTLVQSETLIPAQYVITLLRGKVELPIAYARRWQWWSWALHIILHDCPRLRQAALARIEFKGWWMQE